MSRRGLMRAGMMAAPAALLAGAPQIAAAQSVPPPAVPRTPLAPLQPGVRAGDFAFAAADGRGPDGTLAGAPDAAAQTTRSLDNLRSALRALGQDLEHVVSLWVIIPNYADFDTIARLVNERFPDPQKSPALTLLGNSALDGGCAVRLDAIASVRSDRAPITAPGVPLPPGVRLHGVFASGLAFLSGLSSPEQGNAAGETLYRQTFAVLGNIDTVLHTQGLALGDMCRTFMFQRDLTPDVRLKYDEARAERYKGIFALDKYPANSGIQMADLGSGLMLRSIAIAGHNLQYVVSDKVRRSPNAFSQAVRCGDLAFVAGIDSFDLQRKIQHPGDLAGQTRQALEYTRDIAEAAGAGMGDIVKTTIYLVEGQDRTKFADAYRSYFADQAGAAWSPSAMVLDVQKLSPEALVEIDSIIYLGRR